MTDGPVCSETTKHNQRQPNTTVRRTTVEDFTKSLPNFTGFGRVSVKLYQKFTKFYRFCGIRPASHGRRARSARPTGAQVNEPRDGFLIFHLAFPAGSFLERKTRRS